MKYLQFEVKNMALVKKDNTQLISGAVDYYGLEISFDDEFASIPGIKAVEFDKKHYMPRVDIVDGKVALPNRLLADKDVFQMRVVAGNTIGTPWIQVSITEGGFILPEEPTEPAPELMEYVKTFSGDNAAPYLRATTNGLEYSQDNEIWQSGVSGVPEVEKTKVPKRYVRTYGDWIPLEETAGITEVKVDGVALTPVEGAVDIELAGRTLTGAASQLTLLNTTETDIPTIVGKINEIITALQIRGIATV